MGRVPAEEGLSVLSAENRQYVQDQGKKLIEECSALNELRRELGLTQDDVAQMLNINQKNVSSLESRKDMLVSSLKSYAEAMGCKMKIIIQTPDQRDVRVDNIFS